MPFYVYSTLSMISVGRALDEFHVRLQLEAVLAAFLSTSLVVLLAGLLQWAGALGPINLALVMPLMVLLYIVSYLVALRRYR